jgi:hypothetical protein
MLFYLKHVSEPDFYRCLWEKACSVGPNRRLDSVPETCFKYKRKKNRTMDYVQNGSKNSIIVLERTIDKPIQLFAKDGLYSFTGTSSHGRVDLHGAS